MKKLLAYLLVLIIMLSVLSSCKPEEAQGSETVLLTEALTEENTLQNSEVAKESSPQLKESENKSEAPYELIYSSNGDGTCVLNGVRSSKEISNQTLIVPKFSPDGDKIVKVDMNHSEFMVPQFITADIFEKHISQKLSALSTYESRIIESFFEYKDLESYLDRFSTPEQKEDAKNAFLQKYPICEFGSIYVFTGVTIKEYKLVGNILLKLDFNAAIVKENYNQLLEYKKQLKNPEKQVVNFPCEDIFSKIVFNNDLESINLMLPNLTSIDLKNKVDKFCLEGCENITEIVLPNGITKIDNAALRGCLKLESITIPNSVINIENYAFRDCTTLTNINFSGNKTQWSEIVKGTDWNRDTGNYVVHCSDGDILKADDN